MRRSFCSALKGALRAPTPFLIFDLDGTLVDSLEDPRHSANLFLAEHGLPELKPDRTVSAFSELLEIFLPETEA